MAKIEYNNERIADIKAAGHLTDEEVEDASYEDDEDEVEGGTQDDDARE